MKISIKRKLTIFILVLLVFNLVIISVFTLKGVKNHQKASWESVLKESSKTANLYIREKYLSHDDIDFKTFYLRYGKNLKFELDRILNLKVLLYDMEGRLVQNGSKELGVLTDHQDRVIEAVLQNKIAYVEEGNHIIYGAPVYDFNEQIGALKIVYDISTQNAFYESIKHLLWKVGGISITITFIIAWFYFLSIVRRIRRLKTSVKAVEHGYYNQVDSFKTGDELGELSVGIKAMAKKIEGNINDINAEKRKLEKALNHLQKLEKKQKEFIGNITHEFKTPITVVKAQLDLIHLYNDDEKMFYQSLDIADKELKRLNQMVENILYLSSMEKYDYELQKEHISGDELLHEIINRMRGKAEKYGIIINENIEQGRLVMDQESYMQIMINLIDNAIKYNTHGGKIFIRSYKHEGQYKIEIEDTGIGISHEHKKRIFEPFYTVDKNRSRQFSGTGLGLSLVQRLLKKQRGYIEVMDGNKGTLFLVSIPLK